MFSRRQLSSDIPAHTAEAGLDLFVGRGGGPVYVESGRVSTVGNLRELASLWGRALRDAGLGPGDRVVSALAPGVGFLAVLAAALRLQLTTALVAAGSDLEGVLDQFDASVLVGEGSSNDAWTPNEAGGPPAGRPSKRKAIGPPTPDARLLLASSGTTGSPRWVAISDANLRAVLSSHLPLLGLEGARVLSILPWTHAFGLIIDLLPSLLAGGVVVRDPAGGRDSRGLAELITRERLSHLSAVPLTYRRLAEIEGAALLRTLRGGVVGGAPVTPSLAGLLSGTRLRVGYGLTEASPGVSLGQPGAWVPHALGRPVGCEVRIDETGGLQFRGPNACLGFWSNGKLEREDPDRWVDTGDLAAMQGGELFHQGRSDDQFKLENGRWVRAGECEAALRGCLPSLDESLIFSPDGVHLALAWSGSSEAAKPDLARFRNALGSLGAVLEEAVRVSESEWPRTPKGDIDRRACSLWLAEVIHGASKEDRE